MSCKSDPAVSILHTETSEASKPTKSTLQCPVQSSRPRPHLYGIKVIGSPSHTCEDTWSCVAPLHDIELSAQSLAEENFFSYYGVFDGHGGAQVAEFCSQQLHNVLKDELRIEVVDAEHIVTEALTKSFVQIHNTACSTILNASSCGTTACVALVNYKRIFVANCGDSRAVLSRKGLAVSLSSDHRPVRQDEADRVTREGGEIYWNQGQRVMGILATTRAIGDLDLHSFGVTAEPEVTCFERTDDDEFLILATDGVFDVVSNEEAVRLTGRVIAKAMENGEDRASAIRTAADILGRFSKKRMSTDDITVICVDLMRGAADAAAVAAPGDVLRERDGDSSAQATPVPLSNADAPGAAAAVPEASTVCPESDARAAALPPPTAIATTTTTTMTMTTTATTTTMMTTMTAATATMTAVSEGSDEATAGASPSPAPEKAPASDEKHLQEQGQKRMRELSLDTHACSSSLSASISGGGVAVVALSRNGHECVVGCPCGGGGSAGDSFAAAQEEGRGDLLAKGQTASAAGAGSSNDARETYAASRVQSRGRDDARESHPLPEAFGAARDEAASLTTQSQASICFCKGDETLSRAGRGSVIDRGPAWGESAGSSTADGALVVVGSDGESDRTSNYNPLPRGSTSGKGVRDFESATGAAVEGRRVGELPSLGAMVLATPHQQGQQPERQPRQEPEQPPAPVTAAPMSMHDYMNAFSPFVAYAMFEPPAALGLPPDSTPEEETNTH